MQMPISSVAGVSSASAVTDAATRGQPNLQAGGAQTKAVETTTLQAVKEVSKQPEAAEVKGAVEKINQAVQSSASGLEFSVDEETGINLVKVVDTQTKEVIRQIPSEEAVHIAMVLDKLQGLLVRDKA